MTVSELISELSFYPDDMEVEFAYNYGDYWGTTVCKKIKDVDKGLVEYSDYHRMDKLVKEDEDIDEDEEEIETSDNRKEVLILQ